MRGEKKRYYISTIPKNPFEIKFNIEKVLQIKKERICTDLI